MVISEQNWPHLSFEEVVGCSPTTSCFTDDHGGGTAAELADLRSRPVWRDLRCRRTGPRRGCERRGASAIARTRGRDRTAGATSCTRKRFRETTARFLVTRANLDGAGGIRCCRITRRCADMRPLTPRRVSSAFALGACGLLFVAVVISLRMGAYPISVRDIVMTLLNGALGRRDADPSRNSGSWFSDCGCRASRWGFWWARRFRPPAPVFRLCCESAGRSLRAGVSSGAALGAIISLIVAPHTPGAFKWRLSWARARRSRPLFSWAPRRAARQRNAAACRNRHRVVSFRGHHVPDDHAERPRSARHGFLADGRSGYAAHDRFCGGSILC